MEIIRGRLSAADFSNPSQRYNSDTDTFQYSPDNGANWYNSPEADPRHSNIFRLPPLETSAPRCDAAANMVKWIKDFIDSVISSLEAEATALALTNNFLTTFATLFPPALLLLLLQEAATSLFDTGATALDAAFTSTQYDLLLCAFNCNIEDDGTVTPTDLTNVEAQIAATMDGVPAAIVLEILFIQGEVGLSNAGVIGGLTGDCDDCACAWYYRLDLTVSDWGLAPINYSTQWGDVGACTGVGSWVAGVGFVNSNDGSGWFELGVRGQIPAFILDANPEQWAADFQWATCGGYGYGRWGIGTTTSGHPTNLQGSADAQPNWTGTGLLDRDEGDTQIDMGVCAGGCCAQKVTYIDFWGHGDPPVEP